MYIARFVQTEDAPNSVPSQNYTVHFRVKRSFLSQRLSLWEHAVRTNKCAWPRLCVLLLFTTNGLKTQLTCAILRLTQPLHRGRHSLREDRKAGFRSCPEYKTTVLHVKITHTSHSCGMNARARGIASHSRAHIKFYPMREFWYGCCSAEVMFQRPYFFPCCYAHQWCRNGLGACRLGYVSS